MNRMSRGFVCVFFFTAMVLNNACSKKIGFQTSQVVPAARGNVSVDKDKNKNYVIKIHLDNLAEVTRLPTSKETYVVWMNTDQDSTINLGKIVSKTGFLSNKLNASFETVSSYKPKRIFITAEVNPSIQVPNNEIILSTTSF